jgi:hypothetical protein
MKAKTLIWVAAINSLLIGWDTAHGASAIHYYSFEQEGAVVDTVGSADGTLLNGATVQSGVLALDGVSQYVEFGQELLPTNGSFSVAFFAQELSPTTDRAEIISQGRWFGPGFYMGYYAPVRGLRLGDEWQDTGMRFPKDRLMHHYALTVNEKESCLYFDGVQVRNTRPIHIAGGGNNTRLGRQYDPWPEYFHGTVDELWIYQGALTAAQVAKLAAAKPNSGIVLEDSAGSPAQTNGTAAAEAFPGFVPVTVSETRLSFPTEKGAHYQVQYRSAATNNKWVNLGQPIQGTGGIASVTDSAAAPDKRYRAVATVQ